MEKIESETIKMETVKMETTPALSEVSVDANLQTPPMVSQNELDLFFANIGEGFMFSDMNTVSDASQLCARIQQQEVLMQTVLNDIKSQGEQLEQQRIILNALISIKKTNATAAKRKRPKKDEVWEEQSRQVIVFLRQNRKLPQYLNVVESPLAIWLENAMRDKKENNLTLEQSDCVMYISGLMEGMGLLSTS